MPPGPYAYTSGLFAVELEGTAVGYASSVEGGAIVGKVAGNDQGTPPVRRKDLSGVDYEPITFEVGADMEPELYDWISDTLGNTQPRHDGRILFLNQQRAIQGELAWTDGLLTEISFPELDAASRDAAKIRLTIGAAAITRSSGGGGTVAGIPPRPKQWSASAFRLTIPTMSSAPSSAAWIGPITIKQPYVPPAGGFGTGGAASPTASLDVSDLSVSVAQHQAGELYDWHDRFVVQGYNSQNDELTARIDYLSPDRTQTLLSLDLTGLGVYRIVPERHVSGVQTSARARSDMYVEEIALTVPQPAAAGAGTGSGTTGSGTTSGSSTSSSTSPSEPVASPNGEELIAALRAAVLGGEMRMLAGTAPDAATVAERLLRSSEAAPTVEPTTNGRLADGRRVGADWARSRASLEELEEVAAVAGSDWNALTLSEGHSLVTDLRRNGAVAAEQVGEVVVERDAFIEGVVDAASEVYSEVRPILRERAPGR